MLDEMKEEMVAKMDATEGRMEAKIDANREAVR
jgi:hypothetical protein